MDKLESLRVFPLYDLKKRGISTIVATVLIVLITVASVTVLWVGVMPLIAQSFFVEDADVRFQIQKG